MVKESYFDGGAMEYILYKILFWIVTIISAGLLFPWAACMFYRWETNHTVVNGHRLTFDGTGLQLFGNYIIWLLLSFITLGIYGLWMGFKIRKWIVKHTQIANIENITKKD